MKLSEIAAGIRAHLKRFEDDPAICQIPYASGKGYIPQFWRSGAVDSGRFVYVTYVSYQGASHLTKQQALTYLEWLNAGNVGKHWKAIEAAALTPKGASNGE